MAPALLSPDERPIRLVTFETSPPDFRHPVDGRMAAVADRFAVFENHYLQSTRWGDFYAGTQSDAIASLFASQLTAGRAARFAAPKALDRPLPSWCKDVRMRPHDGAQLQQSVLRFISDCGGARLSWLHFDAVNSLHSDVLASVLETCISDEAITIVTAKNGTLTATPDGFHSSALDDSICVPLWIAGPQQNGCTVQSICGTADIVSTIRSRLSASRPDTGQTEACDFDLLTLSQNPGMTTERTLVIRYNNIEAAMTKNFLLVRPPKTTESQTTNTGPSLYSKPEDTWNIHDVAHEYQSIVSEMVQALKDD